MFSKAESWVACQLILRELRSPYREWSVIEGIFSVVFILFRAQKVPRMRTVTRSCNSYRVSVAQPVIIP